MSMDKRNSASSAESVEDAGGESHSSMTPQLSPEPNKPYSNPLRRSLVLLLDRQRRQQSESNEAAERKVNAFDAAQVLMPSDQLLDNGGRKPQLRLRPVASHDLEECCNICQGSTASFLTPKQRRLSFPPQQQGPLPCRCHEGLASPAPSRAEAGSDSPWGLESCAGTTSRAQLLTLPDKSLQLWMDDDESSEEDERRGSAFRPVMLRPKKDLNPSDADLPSLESSATTSPAEQPPSQPPIPATARGVPLLPNTPEVSKPLKNINLNFKGMTFQDK